jgi:hypothetical protein
MRQPARDQVWTGPEPGLFPPNNPEFNGVVLLLLITLVYTLILAVFMTLDYPQMISVVWIVALFIMVAWQTLERGWVAGLLGGLAALGQYAFPVALFIR